MSDRHDRVGKEALDDEFEEESGGEEAAVCDEKHVFEPGVFVTGLEELAHDCFWACGLEACGDVVCVVEACKVGKVRVEGGFVSGCHCGRVFLEEGKDVVAEVDKELADDGCGLWGDASLADVAHADAEVECGLPERVESGLLLVGGDL